MDKHANNWKDVLRIMGIVKLTNPPRDKEERKLRLWQFEGYWQVKLGTVHPHGLNDINELKQWFKKFQESPIKPQNYKRYRDDTLDICEEEQKELTNWMNDSICKD